MDKHIKDIPLAMALDGFVARDPVYFCTPGHRFEKGVSAELTGRFGSAVFRYDLTETYGLDDLHSPSGAIMEAQKKAAGLYGARHSRFLVNGTTCGIEALIMSCANNRGKLLAARNSHGSVLSGMIISGADPVWMMPGADKERGFYTVISPDTVREMIDEHKDIRAVMLVSPTYYGDISLIKETADICHKREVPLLVDEAHGSHLYFSGMLPDGALKCGADAVVMSTHKTLSGMTQASLLHVNSDLIDMARVDEALGMLMSSSPSYVLMTSLDAARAQMKAEGKALCERAVMLGKELALKLKNIPGVDVYEGSGSGYKDPARVVFSLKYFGISGHDLSDRLFYEHNICLEMADPLNAAAIVTYANDLSDIKKLAGAVRMIAAEAEKSKGRTPQGIMSVPDIFAIKDIPEKIYTPREAWAAEHEFVNTESCEGRISAEAVSPYPPGIPVIMPGELITADVLRILLYCRDQGIKVHAGRRKDINKIKVLK